MKVYELMKELESKPAGAEVTVVCDVTKEELEELLADEAPRELVADIEDVDAAGETRVLIYAQKTAWDKPQKAVPGIPVG